MDGKDKKRTEFSEIGRAAAIEALFKDSGFDNKPAELRSGEFFAHKVMSEGVDFDLVYNPLRHLGYKESRPASVLRTSPSYGPEWSLRQRSTP